MMQHCCSTLALALVATAACQSTDTRRISPPVKATHLRAGTYTLHVCRVTCDASAPRNEIRRGWVVLDSAPIQLSQFPDSIRQALEMGTTFRPRHDSANGCFRLLTTRPEIKSYAGIEPGGLLRWEQISGSDSVSFALYLSPDAAHDVRIYSSESGFAGRGVSSGAGVAAVDYPEDIVVGEYVGPPNVARCAEAGVALVEWLHGVE